MKVCLIFILALFVTACEQRKLTIRERFTDGKINPDGKSGLFVFKREHFYPAQMGLLTTTRPDEYVVNVTIIGHYDIDSGKVRVLFRRDNGKQYLHEDHDFHISQIFGSRALVTDRETNHNWLDINTGTMTPLHLHAEMAQRSREVKYKYLVDEEGTLILDTIPVGQMFDSTVSRQLWIRRSNGEYEQIVERDGAGGAANNHGFRDNELYFYDRKCHIYNLGTRTKRFCENPQDMPRMDNSIELTINFLAAHEIGRASCRERV